MISLLDNTACSPNACIRHAYLISIYSPDNVTFHPTCIAQTHNVYTILVLTRKNKCAHDKTSKRQNSKVIILYYYDTILSIIE